MTKNDNNSGRIVSASLQYLGTEGAGNLQGPEAEDLLNRQRQVTIRYTKKLPGQVMNTNSDGILEDIEEVDLDQLVDQQEFDRFNVQRTESGNSSLFHYDDQNAPQQLAFSSENNQENFMARFNRDD